MSGDFLTGNVSISVEDWVNEVFYSLRDASIPFSAIIGIDSDNKFPLGTLNRAIGSGEELVRKELRGKEASSAIERLCLNYWATVEGINVAFPDKLGSTYEDLKSDFLSFGGPLLSHTVKARERGVFPVYDRSKLDANVLEYIKSTTESLAPGEVGNVNNIERPYLSPSSFSKLD